MKATSQFQRIVIVLFIGASLLLLVGPWPSEAVRGDDTSSSVTSSDQRSQRRTPAQKPSAAVAANPMQCINGILAGQKDCVLNGDLTLNKTLVVSGRMSLDCQKHRLIAAAPGSGTTRSVPEVGILAKDMMGVRITNCFIEGFDFGIYAINSKDGIMTEATSGAQMSKTITNRRTSGRRSANANFAFAAPNRFVLNSIVARYAAITLTRVDNTFVQDNTIVFPVNGGRGIVVQIDSDRNTIQRNILTPDSSTTAPNPLRAPGSQSASNALLVPGQGVSPGGAIVVAQLGGSDPGLLTATVDGQIFQFRATDSVVPNGDFTEDNVVDDNTIVFPDPFPVATDGIALAVPQRTRVTNNRITRATFGVRVGTQFSTTDPKTFRQFPGVCNPGPRLCVGNDDCSGGTCENIPPGKAVQWTSTDTRVLDNRITGPFVGGILVAGRDTLVQDNTIKGPVSQVSGTAPPVTARTGIALFGKHALESTTITRNTVSDASPVLTLTKTFQDLSPACVNSTTCAGSTTCLNLKISLNDFTGYSTAVLLDAGNDLFFDLSLNGQGNYWDLACPGFNQQSVKKLDMMGSMIPTSQVVDCHPYSRPVAKVPIAGLPAPCR